MWQYWLIAAGIFFVGEIFTVGFLLFWFGIASLITMFVSFFTSNIIIQMSIFLVTSTILILSTKPLINKFMNHKTITTNFSSLIGKDAIVVQEIDNLKGTGQIKVNGEMWTALCETNEIIPIGSEVEIIKIEGVKTIIKPISVKATQK